MESINLEDLFLKMDIQSVSITVSPDAGEERAIVLGETVRYIVVTETNVLGEADEHNRYNTHLNVYIEPPSTTFEIVTKRVRLDDFINNFFNFLADHTVLLRLALEGLYLDDIPSSIGRFTQLRELWIRNGKSFSFCPEIALLTNLKILDLRGNNLYGFPVEIGKLINLSVLELSGNWFTTLPAEIGNLTNLKELYLGNAGYGGNGITTLPVEILNLRNLDQLDLRDNLLPVPSEILNRLDKPYDTLNYYFAVTKSKKPINEVKLLVVGQGSVGKTSIIRRILHKKFNPNQSKTEGISILNWKIDNGKESSTSFSYGNLQIKLNIWDFGGQEIMHATHRFFLTKRSLYLLVLDSRLTQEENRVEYWLNIIQSFGGESPVLIVGNKADQHPLDIDYIGLQKKYPKNIVGFLETSAATNVGIEQLKVAIAELVSKLPHIRDLLPEAWFTIKVKLEKLRRKFDFITYDRYLELCIENDIIDEASQRTLIGFLHDLGVVLHFQDDSHLESLGILNPQWVTNGVYKILNSHDLLRNNGKLIVPMLDKILNQPEYPRVKRFFILDVMKKFELCYELEPGKTFLVPDLLPKQERRVNIDNLAFEYVYPVLPSSVITRFIVRMNKKIDGDYVWRTGVLLKIGENRALVKADIEDRKITIAIDGLEHTRRDALSAIRYQLDEIHNSIKGLNPEKRVPIPEAPNAEAIEYDYLLMLEREGQETHLVKDGTRLVKVNVRQILSAIETEAQRKTQSGNVTNIYVGGNFDGNLTVGDGNQSIKDSYNKVTTAKIDPELKQTLQQLVTAVEAMSKSMPEEQSAEVTEDLGKLVDEATKPKPNQKWYSVSIEGLIKAAENLDKLGTPVISLSRKVLSLLTGGFVK
ncbi:MAG: GTP-binding protein [Chloroflexi bacterium]|nr:GTP-binding protein [Chloroflexota bacterium]